MKQGIENYLERTSGQAVPIRRRELEVRMHRMAALLRAAPRAPAGGTGRLLWRDEGGAIRALEIAGPIVVGRSSTCEVRFAGPLVSLRHCRVTPVADGFWIEDLGSTNGTTVNGDRLCGKRPLCPGDLIDVGGRWVYFDWTD